VTWIDDKNRDTLVGTLMCERPAAYPNLYLAIVPELRVAVGCTQNKYHEFDVWEHTLRVVSATPADENLRLAALFHDVGKPSVKGVHPTTGEATFYDHESVGAEMADAILRRLKFSNEIRETVVHLIRHHLVPFNSMPSGSALRRWIRRVGPEHVDAVLELATGDAVGKGNAQVTGCGVEFLRELRERIATMGNESPVVTRESQLAINGNDVMVALGIGPGPVVGAKLRELLELVTDDPELNSREALMEVLQQ
jgi:tRNA nucleotidyltransferase (CCA-adding enzyme)